MFEQVPADYSFLRMHIHPPSGGDTLWGSGVEMYNRMSRPMQKYLQGLTMTADQTNNLISSAKKGGFELWTEPRGHPLNSGTDFTPIHPVVRTNPVTGLNSIYGVGLHVHKFNDVTKAESDYLKQMCLDTLTRNHDMQVRFRWLPKSCAIWDNRSVYHAATPDFDDKYERLGVRYTGVGEKPYFDPATEELDNDIPLADRISNGDANGVANGKPVANRHGDAVKEAMAIH
jgi:alpha-ketoglutarate-dependent taurine dioxygenase